MLRSLKKKKKWPIERVPNGLRYVLNLGVFSGKATTGTSGHKENDAWSMV